MTEGNWKAIRLSMSNDVAALLEERRIPEEPLER